MFKAVHNNFNVFDLQKSITFYNQALCLKEVKRIIAPDGSFIIVYLGNPNLSSHLIELTWLKERTTPYNLGDNEFHLAFTVEDFEDAKKIHKEMDCLCYENETMGIYFIEDPDGYWIEIMPEK